MADPRYCAQDMLRHRCDRGEPEWRVDVYGLVPSGPLSQLYESFKVLDEARLAVDRCYEVGSAQIPEQVDQVVQQFLRGAWPKLAAVEASLWRRLPKNCRQEYEAGELESVNEELAALLKRANEVLLLASENVAQ